MRRFLQKYAVALAFCGIALAAGTAIDSSANHAAFTLYRSQLQACSYENRHLRELNNRVEVVAQQRNVLLDLLIAAREARFAAYQHSHQTSDLAAARKYSRLIAIVQTKIYYHTLPAIDCHRTIKRP